MISRSSSPMKVDKPRSYHISQNFHIYHLTEDEENQTITKVQSLTKMSLFSENDMVSEGSEDEIDENEIPTRSLFKIEAEGDKPRDMQCALNSK